MKSRKVFAFRILSVLSTLLPMLSSEAGSMPFPVSSTPERPYLRHVAPPPIRLQEPPPVPVYEPLSAPVETAEVEAPVPTGDSHKDPVSQPVTTPSTAAAEQGSPVSKPDPATVAPTPAPPAPILQDTLKQQVRLEDLMPFFRLPGSERSDGLPASSATYRRE